MTDHPNPFDGAEVISTYTDTDAVEDGVLVSINKADRVSRPLFDCLVADQPTGSKPPDCWPVAMMDWFGSKTPEQRAHAMCKGLIGKYDRIARRVYENNTDGGIFKVYGVRDAAGKFASLDESQPPEVPTTGIMGAANSCAVIWIMPNENGGITLLFPSDY
jgi:hypothetical protein